MRANFLRGARSEGPAIEIEPAVRGGEHAEQHRDRWRTTGAPLRASEVEAFARATRDCDRSVRGVAGGATTRRFPPNGSRRWRATLSKHRGACIVIAGEEQPAIVHALAHAMNAALGNVGQDRALHRADRSESRRTRWIRCASW